MLKRWISAIVHLLGAVIVRVIGKPCKDLCVNFKQLERMPEGIEYVRGSSRFDETRGLRFTDFTNAGGERFMRIVGPESDVWHMLLPAWYECWPTRLIVIIKAFFTPPSHS
jgi:hypothetical protein